jgi:hypothetical protein
VSGLQNWAKVTQRLDQGARIDEVSSVHRLREC